VWKSHGQNIDNAKAALSNCCPQLYHTSLTDIFIYITKRFFIFLKKRSKNFRFKTFYDGGENTQKIDQQNWGF
jgi:hypothetical protein